MTCEKGKKRVSYCRKVGKHTKDSKREYRRNYYQTHKKKINERRRTRRAQRRAGRRKLPEMDAGHGAF